MCQNSRCLYNALNDKIRNLLLSYDYSKSTDPLQPLAGHVTSLLTRDHPQTADIVVTAVNQTFNLHKFVLSARSPYFYNKLSTAPETTSWKLPTTIPSQSFGIALRHVYLGEIPRDLGGGPGTGFTESEILGGLDKISKHLEIPSLSELFLNSSDRRLARQRRTEEVEKGRDQLELWFRNNVLKHKVTTDCERAQDVKWDRDNGIFADVLLRADEVEGDDEDGIPNGHTLPEKPETNHLGIPIGPAARSRSPSRHRKPLQSTLFPCHKAMLLRSEFFLTMFSSGFREAQDTPHLQIIPIDCSPRVLEIVLTFLYTERADFPLDIALDVLFVADLLLIEKLKAKAAVVISTLGNGTATAIPALSSQEHNKTGNNGIGRAEPEDEFLDIYSILRAAWFTRVQRLEEFAARYLAYRLEAYIDDPDFADLVKESATRISARQETDSIELIDDIRYYLSERFRLRFEDAGLEEMMDEEVVPEGNTVLPTDAAKGSSTEAPWWGTNGDTGQQRPIPEDEGVDVSGPSPADLQAMLDSGAVRTLDGDIAGDEFAADAANYQNLLGKIEGLLEKLKLDA